MPKIQECRNGCRKNIILQEDPMDEKWKPYDIDDAGNPWRLHQCPNNPYYSSSGGGGTKSSSFKKTPSYVQSTTSTSTTAGGQTLDTKRILQTLVELTTEVRELKSIFDARTIIDTNKYEGLNNQLYNALAKYINEGSIGTASTLLDPKQRQSIIDPSTVKHADKADEYERTKQFVEEGGGEIEKEDENDTGGAED